jgi:hypothetical protein
MRKLKPILNILHVDERGALRQTIEALLVGGAMIGILLAAVVMFNGGVIGQQPPAPSPSDTALKQTDSRPGPMASDVLTGDKINDTINKDLSSMRNKVELDPAALRILQGDNDPARAGTGNTGN